MAKSRSRSQKGRNASVQFSLKLDPKEAPWAQAILPSAKQQGKSLEEAMTDALRDWLWHASGLRRMFDQVREAGELMTRSFQVEGMLVSLAKSGGISLGQQTEYLKRAQEERAQYKDQRKKVQRLVREIRRLADETRLPSAIDAAAKLVVPD